MQPTRSHQHKVGMQKEVTTSCTFTSHKAPLKSQFIQELMATGAWFLLPQPRGTPITPQSSLGCWFELLSLKCVLNLSEFKTKTGRVVPVLSLAPAPCNSHSVRYKIPQQTWQLRSRWHWQMRRVWFWGVHTLRLLLDHWWSSGRQNSKPGIRNNTSQCSCKAPHSTASVGMKHPHLLHRIIYWHLRNLGILWELSLSEDIAGVFLQEELHMFWDSNGLGKFSWNRPKWEPRGKGCRQAHTFGDRMTTVHVPFS